MANLPPKYVPHQSRISVQNVPEYGTPAGASMANEEFRRIGLAVNQLQDKLDAQAKKGDELGQAVSKVQSQLPPVDASGKPIGMWATTVFSNSVPVGTPKVAQGITFKDLIEGDATAPWPSFGATFYLSSQALEKQYSTLGTATNVTVTAKVPVNPHMPWAEKYVKAHVRRSIEYVVGENVDSKGNKYYVLQLVNDIEDPPANYYYGTDSTGLKGWYLLAVPDQTVVDKVARLNLRNLFSEIQEASSFVETWNVAAMTTTISDNGPFYSNYLGNPIAYVPLNLPTTYFYGDRCGSAFEDSMEYTFFQANISGYYYAYASLYMWVDSNIEPVAYDATRISLAFQKAFCASPGSYTKEIFIGYDPEKLMHQSTAPYHQRVFQYQIKGAGLIWLDVGDRVRLALLPNNFPPAGSGTRWVGGDVRMDIFYVGEQGLNGSLDRMFEWRW